MGCEWPATTSRAPLRETATNEPEDTRELEQPKRLTIQRTLFRHWSSGTSLV
jgi:hypothetical protein